MAVFYYIGETLRNNDNGGYYQIISCNNVLNHIDLIPSIGYTMYSQNENQVITIDGCHTCYKNLKILVAVMIDGCGKLQLVAASLCLGESEHDYQSFLSLIKEHIIKDKGKPIIVADRCPGIQSAASTVFGLDFKVHTCLVHLLRNVDSWIKKGSIAKRGRIRRLVNNYARCCNEEKAEVFLNELRQIDPDLVQRLQSLPTIWSRLQCDNRAFGIITSNAAESINGRMKRAVDNNESIRNSYIIDMVIGVYSLMQTQIEVRSEQVKSEIKNLGNPTTSTITQYVMKKINSQTMYLIGNRNKWRITNDKVCFIRRNTKDYFSINLAKHSCTCKLWERQGFPCIHAVAYLLSHNIRITSFSVKLVNSHYLTHTVIKTCNRSLPNTPDLIYEDASCVIGHPSIVSAVCNEVNPEVLHSTSNTKHKNAKRKRHVSKDTSHNDLLKMKRKPISKRKKSKMELAHSYAQMNVNKTQNSPEVAQNTAIRHSAFLENNNCENNNIESKRQRVDSNYGCDIELPTITEDINSIDAVHTDIAPSRRSERTIKPKKPFTIYH